MRMHYRKRSKERDRWAWMVMEAVKPPRPVYQSCHMKVTRQAARALDWDNMGGGLKFVLDAIVNSGILPDDNPKVILSLTLAQEQVPGKSQRTIIELLQLDRQSGTR